MEMISKLDVGTFRINCCEVHVLRVVNLNPERYFGYVLYSNGSKTNFGDEGLDYFGVFSLIGATDEFVDKLSAPYKRKIKELNRLITLMDKYNIASSDAVGLKKRTEEELFRVVTFNEMSRQRREREKKLNELLSTRKALVSMDLDCTELDKLIEIEQQAVKELTITITI